MHSMMDFGYSTVYSLILNILLLYLAKFECATVHLYSRVIHYSCKYVSKYVELFI